MEYLTLEKIALAVVIMIMVFHTTKTAYKLISGAINRKISNMIHDYLSSEVFYNDGFIHELKSFIKEHYKLKKRN